MYWKDSLAKEILANGQVRYGWLVSRQSDYPSLRVKTIDARGEIPVIQLSGGKDWMKPKEWANNHIANLKQRYIESQTRLVELGSDPSETCSSTCPVVCELKNSNASDPDEVERLHARLDKANHNYIMAMEALCRLKRNGDLSPDELTAIAKWRAEGESHHYHF